MSSTKSMLVLGAVALAVAAAVFVRSSRGEAEPPPPQREALERVPTFIELGSDRCTSCRAMIPVLEELRRSNCKLNVRFVDVWKDPSEGERLGVTTIPTQVLLAPDGREIARHTGYWSADAIRAAFASSGFAIAVEPGDCGS
ncbi:MAG: thioredoxin family protein [Myxococcota bacterium]